MSTKLAGAKAEIQNLIPQNLNISGTSLLNFIFVSYNCQILTDVEVYTCDIQVR